MNKKKIEAKIQYNGNYVKDFKINVLEKNIPEKKELKIELKVGISKLISDNEGYKRANVSMIYNIYILSGEKRYIEIHMEIVGNFRGSEEMNEEELENMLKINGAPVLSQSARAYISAVTALSGIETITLPMINFFELFNQEQETIENNENKNTDDSNN